MTVEAIEYATHDPTAERQWKRRLGTRFDKVIVIALLIPWMSFALSRMGHESDATIVIGMLAQLFGWILFVTRLVMCGVRGWWLLASTFAFFWSCALALGIFLGLPIC